MARAHRKCIQGVTYHCYSRCIELRNLLSANRVKDIAVKSIKMAHKKYNFELVQLEFVENHFHIVINTLTDGETISRIMQYIKARIAEKYNKMTKRTGSFWNERFKCKIIEESDNPENYFFRLLWYIAYNPVRKKIISDPRESQYGAIRIYLEINYRAKAPAVRHQYFNNLGRNFEERVKNFLIFEESYKQKYSTV